MRETEVIRILNDVNKAITLQEAQKKIREHIDSILDRMENKVNEKRDFPAGITDVNTPFFCWPEPTLRMKEQSGTEAEQNAQTGAENVQDAEQTTEKSSASEPPLLRSKDLAKPVQTKKPPGGAKQTFDTGKLRALRRAGWTVKKIAEEMNCSEATIYNHMKKEGIK